jgi:hypothetical protein
MSSNDAIFRLMSSAMCGARRRAKCGSPKKDRAVGEEIKILRPAMTQVKRKSRSTVKHKLVGHRAKLRPETALS